MKVEQLFKNIAIILVFLFIAIYVTTKSNYQQIENQKQNILTEEAIKRFEQDVSEGKEIIASNYNKRKKDFSSSKNFSTSACLHKSSSECVLVTILL